MPSVGIYDTPLGKYQIRLVYDGTGNLTYIGKANSGELTSEEAWQIMKLSYTAGGDLQSVAFANGSPAFVFIMDNAATYTFS
ncbi:MAG TPA: hypothetical protein PLN86_16910 [Candidatus Hydrogenedentes bacterium]|nr:hypothetical protein [Candidatus Hydrogenedentota bacterium]